MSQSLPLRKNKMSSAALQHRRSAGSLVDISGKFVFRLRSKSPNYLIDKFIRTSRTENCRADNLAGVYSNLPSTDWGRHNCLQGSYRNNGEEDSHEIVQAAKTQKGCYICKDVTLSAYPDRLHRRRLLNIISDYDKKNRELYQELSREKRRRIEELAAVVKSLLGFETKLKRDMKDILKCLIDSEAEICRLTRINSALLKRLHGQERLQELLNPQEVETMNCLVLEALQCNKCLRKPSRKGMELNTELDATSDDTISSSFHDARRSVRYTSKRTSGTFREYIRSRSMHFNNIACQQQSEENTSSVSNEDSQKSSAAFVGQNFNKIRCLQSARQHQRRNNLLKQRCVGNISLSKNIADKYNSKITDNDRNELDYMQAQQMLISQKRCADFSEASPMQIFETSMDDWYATVSDQEEPFIAYKPYGQGAVNPVLECVNQILVQQSMEEAIREPVVKPFLDSDIYTDTNIPCTSFIKSVNNTRKRVHFSTKSSTVHVSPNKSEDSNQFAMRQQPLYHTMITVGETPNYESIYSNDYEPVGSDRASNLYVDMASTSVETVITIAPNSFQHLPPDLPPKPANLLKFRNSLHHLEEPLKNKHSCEVSTTTLSEPDYCSICEVGMPNVRFHTMAEVHPEPKSSSNPLDIFNNDHIAGHSDSHSCKNVEIDDILADIPKLPNVAAIIAPKPSSPNYLVMTPKTPQSGYAAQSVPSEAPEPNTSCNAKRTILTETNKFISSPTIPTMSRSLPSTPVMMSGNSDLADSSRGMAIQAEFDWYNLDIEYERGQDFNLNPPVESFLEKISENGKCLSDAAYEYNLDEEFEDEEHRRIELNPQLPSVEEIKTDSSSAEANRVLRNFAHFET